MTIAIMNRGSDVYFGPSDSGLYPSSGSVSANEVIQVKWKEGSGEWSYIDYQVDNSDYNKCGYVKSSYIDFGDEDCETRITSSAFRYVNQSSGCTTYYGPNPYDYMEAGSVSYWEQVTFLGIKTSDSRPYAFIEYQISNTAQKKRAWMAADYLNVQSPVVNMLNIARGEIGYSEGPNDATKYGRWYEERYGDSFREAPWCAMFVSWCAYQAGILSDNSTDVVPYVLSGAYVPYMYNKYNNSGRILTAASTTPQIGDIAFCRQANSDMLDHVAIVSAVNGNQVTYVEGNSAEGDVRESTFTNNGSYIRYFGR